MTDRGALLTEVLAFVNSGAFKHTEPVGPDDELIRSGLLDSFGFVVLWTHLEATYGISMSAEDLLELDHFRSASRLAAYLARRLDGTSAPIDFTATRNVSLSRGGGG